MKLLKKVFSLALVLSVMLMSLGFIVSAEEIRDQTPSVIDKPYEYPIKPGTDEWKDLADKEEKLKVSQIPEDVLTKLSTEALIESVLNYPLLVDMLAFNSYEQGFNAVASNFNGLQELLKRDDAGIKLFEKYNKKNSSLNVEQTNYRDSMYLKVMLSQNVLSSKLSAEQLKELKSGHDSSVQANTYVKTPNGTNVLVYQNPEMLSSADKAQIAKDIALSYPNATKLRDATSVYNCHSYAWYSTSSTNPYWMDNPSAYWTDGSYKSSSSGAAGYRIYYSTSGNEHTGIINSVLYGPPAPGKGWSSLTDVTSKWGMAGLYKHRANDCPYYSSESALRYYYR
ncbi:MULTISPECIES: hypothetical protein [Paenibacillus]|uniref:hypothetical protein n=1 Tax=Paenibacillus TaxID=44249 RepID=UPI00048B1D6A|nr:MULTISPECIES: hypothetical protein [Paenibacillus]GIO91350.1 hypothetical protein J31TS3_25770 [Paenibacillus lactis]